MWSPGLLLCPQGLRLFLGQALCCLLLLILVLLPTQDLSLNLSPSQIWAALHGSEVGEQLSLSFLPHSSWQGFLGVEWALLGLADMFP